MIKKVKVMSVSSQLSNELVPEVVTQEFAFGMFPTNLYSVYDSLGFDVKVGQWVYIDTLSDKLIGVKEKDI